MADSRPRILVVDDNPKMVSLLVDELNDAGYAVDTAAGGEAAIARMRAEPFDLVITDLRMEKVDGLDVLKAARAIDEALPVMIMTAFGAVESAVEAIRAGAYHYFTKPFKIAEVLVFVGRAVADRRMRDENRALRKVAVERNGFASMVGRSDAMRRVYDAIERVAPSPATVLVRGESGVGKELVARALHFAGPRRDHAFVAVNCTALPEPLLESELFGHVRGAFTGAASVRRGLLVEADRRHPVSRRDRRHAARSAAEAVAGARRRGGPADRRRCPAQHRRPRRRRDQSGSRAPRAGGQLPRRSVLSAQRRADHRASVARPRRRHSGAARSLPRKRTRAQSNFARSRRSRPR